MQDTLFAAACYDLLLAPFDKWLIVKWRRLLWHSVRGPRVLEVGVGTGLNIPHYPSGFQITALDKGQYFLRRADRRARRLNVPVNFVRGDLLALPFAEAAFDSVVSTFLFCSVDDPKRGLQEICRVLKPGGTLLLLEHGVSRGLSGKLMNALAGPVYRITGDHINRDIEALLPETGFKKRKIIPLLLDVVKLIPAEKQQQAASVNCSMPG